MTLALKIPSRRIQSDSRRPAKNSTPSQRFSRGPRYEILARDLFSRMLSLERKRAERSRKLLLLMLVDAGKFSQIDQRDKVLHKIVSTLSSSTRETDIAGWYEENSVLGVIFAEIDAADRSSILHVIRARVVMALLRSLDPEHVNQIHISFHFFPKEWNDQKTGLAVDSEFYPDLLQRDDSRRFSRLIKRTMDIVGSIIALAICWPLFVVISIAIKLTSKGPILFRQARVGQYGMTFTCLKFRSMEFVNDTGIHKEYIKRFISGKVEVEQARKGHPAVYKIRDDPRLTPIGKFLRKTSLDELPQLVNVLKGEMSLVGPRPPIPYELESYDVWHRRRVLEAKPGITGLWQVNGRSRTSFNDMVRLDLRYARAWSPWLDIKILLQTPRAVFFGEGAY
jgi:exopolysaccharide biosynthesis polyprenyl glycosylphosphotransferase